MLAKGLPPGLPLPAFAIAANGLLLGSMPPMGPPLPDIIDSINFCIIIACTFCCMLPGPALNSFDTCKQRANGQPTHFRLQEISLRHEHLTTAAAGELMRYGRVGS